MNLLWVIAIGWLVLTGLVGFILMGIDKARAQDGGWRVPERTFFKLALIGGALGMLAGSSVFHHKAQKDSFIEIIVIMAVGWVIVLVGLKTQLGAPFG